MCFCVHTNRGIGLFPWRQVLPVYQTILSFYPQVGYLDEGITLEYYKQAHFFFSIESIQKFLYLYFFNTNIHARKALQKFLRIWG